MGTFLSPSLTTTLTSAGWRTELNNNFANINTAFGELETLWGAIDLTRLADFTGVVTRRLPVSCQNAGTISAGVQGFGMIVPFQGVVEKAYARVSVAPPDTVSVDLEEGSGATWNSILAAPLAITAGTTTPVSALAGTDNLLDVGNFIRVNVTTPSSGLGSMANLSIVVLLTPRDWDIYA